MGYSQNYGPHSVRDYNAAPSIYGYQTGTTILGTILVCCWGLGFGVRGLAFRGFLESKWTS